MHPKNDFKHIYAFNQTKYLWVMGFQIFIWMEKSLKLVLIAQVQPNVALKPSSWCK
jgi:hypothetical protein